mmetsp:Transcript_38340/g.38700  ORF Transcript_38340/g.38700 Transcript_38340/m.38700 type:complete len:80 (+) Transcript_38340:2130-2369(+)
MIFSLKERVGIVSGSYPSRFNLRTMSRTNASNDRTSVCSSRKRKQQTCHNNKRSKFHQANYICNHLVAVLFSEMTDTVQ